MVAVNFNALNNNASVGGGTTDIFEDGVYRFQITGSEVKATKAGTGNMLIWTLTCIEEGMEGMTYLWRMNLQNPNPTAVAIATGELTALSYVTRKPVWQESQELHGIPFAIQMEKKPRSDDSTKSENRILDAWDANGVNYKDIETEMKAGGGGAPAAPVAAAPPVTSEPVASSPVSADAPKKPWEN